METSQLKAEKHRPSRQARPSPRINGGYKMFYKDINAKSTAKVAELIARGYTINTATMSGSQGEISKVDLTDGKEVIRVLLDRFSGYAFGEGLEIKVGKVSAREGVIPNAVSGLCARTIWNDRLEIISSETYYQVGSRSRNGSTYYGTEEEANEARKKQLERYKARDLDETRELPESAKQIALAYIRRQPKCGRKKISDIDRVYHYGNGYIISCNNTAYRIH